MQRRIPTFLGLAAMVLAFLGIVVALLGLAMTRGGQLGPHEHSVFMLQFVLSVATKSLLLMAGMMLISRSPAALPLIVSTLLLSLAHSVVMQWWTPGPALDGLDAAGRAGRVAGWETALWLPPVLYVALIAYLRTPASRAEFGGVPRRSEATF